DAANTVAQALQAWANVADITFVKSNEGPNTPFELSGADLAFSLADGQLVQRRIGAIGLSDFPDPSGAADFRSFMDFMWRSFNVTYDTSYPHPEGDVFLESNWSGWGDFQPGGAELQVILHEIGHALGLKHPFDDGANFRPTFAQLGIGS